MEGSTAVIKVRYGDVLRRFNSPVVDKKLFLNMDGLREKIVSLFSFAPDTDLMLTYVDEDGDVVALVDDDDLCDIVKQDLNPLRLTVKVNDKNGNQNHSNSGSTPSRSHRAQHLPNLIAGVTEILKKVPEPLRETLMKLSDDLAVMASSTSPSISELVDNLSKVSSLLLGQKLSESGLNMQNGFPDSSSAMDNKVSEPLRVDPSSKLWKVKPAANMDEKEIEIQNVTGQKEDGPSFDFNDVAKAIKSMKFNTTEPGSVGTSHTSRRKEKTRKTDECSDRKSHVGKVAECSVASSNLPSQVDNKLIGNGIRNSTEPKTASNSAGDGSCLMNLSWMREGGLERAQLQNPQHAQMLNALQGGLEKARLQKAQNAQMQNAQMQEALEKAWSQNAQNMMLNNALLMHSAKMQNAMQLQNAQIQNPIQKNALLLQSKQLQIAMQKNAPLQSARLLNPYSVSNLPRATGIDKGPYSGTSENMSVASSHWASDEGPSKSNGQNDSSGMVHLGVRCDGCGIHPIVGPRFKSEVKVDYDLCLDCHQKMGKTGKGNEYIRIDGPAVSGDPTLLAREQAAILQLVSKGSKAKLGAVKLDSRFIQDVNIFDGTVMAPLTPFTKIWRMRNNGTLAWPHKTQLVWIGGDRLTDTLSVEVHIPAAGLPIDQELDIAVDFISPELPGRYISYWRMASPFGPKFGQRVWVQIQVDASNTETPHESVRNLNLNLPPASTGPEIIIVDPKPVVEVCPPKDGNSKKEVEFELPNTENELKFPINDSLLVGDGAGSSSTGPSSSSSAPQPIIDLTDAVPTLSSVPRIPFPPFSMPPPPPPPFVFRPPFSIPPTAPVIMPPPPPPQHGVSPQPLPQRGVVPRIPPHVVTPPLPLPPTEHVASSSTEPDSGLQVKGLIEDKLLTELEEMGFKQVDLNKKVLRMNEYDLEQAVDDLCGVAEWDPILEELNEMGFHDTDMNKMLLKKKQWEHQARRHGPYRRE